MGRITNSYPGYLVNLLKIFVVAGNKIAAIQSPGYSIGLLSAGKKEA